MRRTMAHSNSLPTKRPSWSSFTSSAVWKKNPRDIGHHLINMIPVSVLSLGRSAIYSFSSAKCVELTKLPAVYQAWQTENSKNLSNRTLWHCVLIHTPLIPPPNKIQKLVKGYSLWSPAHGLSSNCMAHRQSTAQRHQLAIWNVTGF